PSMPTNFFLGGMPNPYQAYTPVDLHSFLSSYALTREPGAQEEYSNLGVALLGRLLSQRAGTDYEKLLQDRVLRPLGMSSTAVTLNAEQLSRLAPGHDRYLELVAPWNLDTLPGSGGLRSSANDLLNYLEAFLGYRETALKSAMEYGLSTRQPPGSTNAVTWGVSRSGTREVFGHDGGKEGYRAAIVFNPRTRTGIVVLANSRTDDRPMALAWHLLYGRPLPRTTRAPTKPTVPAPATESLDLLAGRYELAPGKILIVARRDKHLLVDTTGAGVESFYYAGTDEFASNENDARLLFTRAEAGRGSEVMLVQGGQKSGAKRVQ
ncbi:MAG TPA: serine hydrolase domain-containing protein, partial [Steroidobacteraceae bacterium]|nr:serine hydrolase domain-containing protein [Steroidobacteraceae bacterium]